MTNFITRRRCCLRTLRPIIGAGQLLFCLLMIYDLAADPISFNSPRLTYHRAAVCSATESLQPVIGLPPLEPICSFSDDEAQNCPTSVTVDFSVTETCNSGDAAIHVYLDLYAVDNNNDGEVTGSDFFGNDTLSALVTATNDTIYSLNTSLPLGVHLLQVVVDDDCGNSDIAYLPIEVVDCLAPAPTCITGVIVELLLVEPNTDADGDGDIDQGAAGIWAADYIVSPVADCTPPVNYSINRSGDVPDMNQAGIILTCDDDFFTFVQIYAWDSSDNPYSIQPDGTVGGPNYDFCEIEIYVADNLGFCNGPGPDPYITGYVATEEDEPVEGVDITFSGTFTALQETNDEGWYELSFGIYNGGGITITPSYTDATWLNGVSTFDMVLISKHILGIAPLDSPYKIIAADINRSNSVTTLDLIKLRRLILGIVTEIEENTPWRFVDAAYVFPQPTNPFIHAFLEAINLNNLYDSFYTANFVAIKIGDVNGSVVTTVADAPVTPYAAPNVLTLHTEDRYLTAGERYSVTLEAADAPVWIGYQGTFQVDPAQARIESIDYGVLGNEHLNQQALGEGLLPFSWFRLEMGALADGPLLTLHLRAIQSGWLSESLRLTDAVTHTEAYRPTGEHGIISFNFNRAVPFGKLTVEQNVPNPARDLTTVGYTVTQSGMVQLQLHNALGQLVWTDQQTVEPGQHRFTVDASVLSPHSVLWYTIRQHGESVTQRMAVH